MHSTDPVRQRNFEEFGCKEVREERKGKIDASVASCDIELQVLGK
jgi:hypothetical protein